MRSRRHPSAAPRPDGEPAHPGAGLHLVLLALLCVALAAAPTALAHDPIFRYEPDWESLFNELGRTSAVAVGDLNGDGYLDVVFGQRNEPLAAYANEEGELAPTPYWESSEEYYTYDLALFDIDEDGDADLVHVAATHAVEVFLNHGGVFAETPFWSADPAAWTQAVALGDVDGDGDLDLACANDVQQNTLYLNEGGTFAAEPVWRSDPAYHTSDLVFGDVDGDGDLDLVCLNGTFGQYEPVTVYFNDGQGLATAPSWPFLSRNAEGDLALGDVDGDGDLDLACTNGQAAARLYLNTGTGFGPGSLWSSGAVSAPRCLAFIDGDDDGDLDLVCGTGAANALYANRGGSFSTIPDWTSQRTYATLAIATGDMDRDGDLDLVCGNFEHPNALFVNEGGTIGAFPAWWLESPYFTFSLATGDIDGDGAADLVCGNDRQPSTAYRGQSGFFARTASWTAGTSAETGAVTLGDLNGDGRLDLVCGNGVNEPERTVLYLNNGSWFPATPSWSTDSLDVTGAVALGDIDNDGDLDLACGVGNYLHYGQNAVYLNDAGVLPPTPSWTSLITRHTNSVALADITGNGYLDLVCGNPGTNFIYHNDGGQLSPLPSWQSAPSDETFSVVVGDVDGDGDLDLVCGNDVENTLYRNEGGALETTPAWRSSERTWTYAVALSDVDGDGDLDLVCGNHSAPSTNSLYLNEGGTFAASPVWVSLAEDDTKALAVLDVDGDGDDDIITADAIDYQNGRINVFMNRWNRQPLLTPDPRVITAAAVTVGDTTLVTVALGNVGRRPLVVTDVILPSVEMRSLTDTPLTILPGANELVTIVHAPTLPGTVPDYVVVESNDFATPMRAIPITAPIIPLRVQHRLVNTAEEIPLGEATTVIVSGVDGARIERGVLYHRPAGSAAFADSVVLVPWSGDHIATIPGEFITEAGLEFYVRVFNSGIVATDPPHAPQDSVVFQAVAASSAIASAAVPNFGTEYRAGLPLTVGVSLQQGTQFVSGAVHYRPGGASAYRTLDLRREPPLLVATVPGDSVGFRGIEYYVEVTTPTGVLTDPATAPALAPKTLAVTVFDLSEDEAAPAERYRLVSVPLDFGGRTDVTLESLLADQDEFGPYDPRFWRAFRFDPPAAGYRELSEEEAASVFSLAPGKGYWLACRDGGRIETAPVAGYSTPTDTSYAIELAPGWNQIGHPFAFPVAWDAVRVNGMAMADAEGAVIEAPVQWVIGEGYRLGLEILRPWQGYWVRNLSDAVATLRVPPQEAAGHDAADPAASNGVAGPPLEDGWMVTITAASGNARDAANVFGVRRGAQETWDRYDRADPPPWPGQGLSVYFPHPEWARNAGAYTVDMRAAKGEAGEPAGQAWSFAVAKNFVVDGAGDEVALEFRGLEAAPADLACVLLDRRLARAVDLRVQPRYTLHLGRADLEPEQADTRFVVLAGDAAFVAAEARALTEIPQQTTLHPNRPNPFNPLTVIRFDLAQAARTSVKIYDVSGALVQTLFAGDLRPGGYEFVWNGEDAHGQRVAAGVYFCRLDAGGQRETRKMALIK